MTGDIRRSKRQNAAAVLQEQEVCGLINMEEREDGKTNV